MRKVRERIKVNQQTPAGQLIGQLNPLLRGWANYHCHVVSKVTFKKMDHAIFQRACGVGRNADIRTSP